MVLRASGRLSPETVPLQPRAKVAPSTSPSKTSFSLSVHTHKTKRRDSPYSCCQESCECLLIRKNDEAHVLELMAMAIWSAHACQAAALGNKADSSCLIEAPLGRHN
eukprot:1052729-Amphidinium_carterae.1